MALLCARVLRPTSVALTVCWELQGVGTLRYGEADAKEKDRMWLAWADVKYELGRTNARTRGNQKGQ